MEQIRRLIVCALLTALSQGLTWGAPITRVLEDFEGRLVGWPKGATLVDDASQGEKALAWKVPATSGPKAYMLQLKDRRIEMIEWDRLRFDYKIEGKGCNWWGVKIVDYPLADGMQATWQIGDKKSLAVGAWQTAEIDIQHPKWHWGEKPDRSSQWLHFRCQLDKGKSVTILLDNIRIERDQFRIESVEQQDSVREGDVLKGVWRVTLSNTTDRPLPVVCRVRETDARLTASLAREKITIPPGLPQTVEVELSLPVAGPNAVPALSSLSTQFFARVADMEDVEKTASLSLAVPLGETPHPSLLITKEIAQGVLKRVETSEDAKAAYESLKQAADAWLAKTPEFPDRGGQWWHWYTCKKCGARLGTKSPTEHVCPDCGEVYSGWPYDDVVLDRQHSALARAIRDLGLMYVFTGEEAYAEKAREILMGYAERYLEYPLHNIHGEPKRGGGHVGPQSLDESTWLIPVAQGFDCVYDTLSQDDIAFIAEKMLLPAARLIHDHQWGIHNICCWHDSAYGLVGITLGEEQLAADAINGPKGFRAQIEQGVTDDGQWYEGAWGYHYYTMMALQPLAIAARNIGIDLYTERYKGMYDAPLAFMAPGGILPAFNDSGRANALGAGNMYEVAYAQWKDPRHLLPILNQRSRRSLEFLLYGEEVGEAPEFQLASRVFPAAGFVVLRSGALGGAGAARYVPENYIAFDWGPHGGGHGHPDKLSFVLYAKRKLLAEDPGCIAYGNPAHRGWFRQTLSHNTIVVNGKSQTACTGVLQFAALEEGIGLCSARADDAYPGVRLRRTLALVGDRVIDILLCEAEEEATFDWAYHNRGEMVTTLPLEGMEKAPEGDGYGWAKEWKSAAAKESWSATWRTEDGVGVLLAQSAAEGEREVLSAIGMGNPTRVKNPFVVSRVKGEGALYCTALEVFEGEAPQELTVRELAIESGPPRDERPVAVEVLGAGARDVVLVNPAGGVLRVGELRLEGQGAVLHYEGEELARVLLVGDSEVRLGDKAL